MGVGLPPGTRGVCGVALGLHLLSRSPSVRASRASCTASFT